MISYQAQEVELPQIRKRDTTAWIRRVAARYGKKTGEIAYIFCTDEYLREINNRYLQHDYYTDIVTFDYTQGDTISGDIFISLDRVRENSRQYAPSYDDELRRVVIHGVLHLCGLKDKEPHEREQMEAAENEALAML